MAYTQRDIELLRLHNKQVRIKVVVLDENYQEVDEAIGKVKSVSFPVDAMSNIRRTCNLSLVLDAENQSTATFENTWSKRMVELYCGIFDNLEGDYRWYPMGKLLLKNCTVEISTTVKEIKLSLVDLMASLMSERGSQMGADLVIPAGSVIKNVLAAIVAEFAPFKLYNIMDFEDVVPYDIIVNTGSYPFDAIHEVLNLFPYCECFYDNNGVFTVQKIPTKISDSIDIGKDIITPLLIAERIPLSFSKVKNTTEIWGRSLDAEYTALECKTVSGCYNLTIDDTFKVLENGATYGFTPDTSSVANQTIKIQDTEQYPLMVENGIGELTPVTNEELHAGIPYVVRYNENNFILQGELEIHVIVQEISKLPSEEEQQRFKEDNACRDVQWVINPESTFACRINGIGRIDGEIRQVLFDGEYSNIYTTQLAFERARYENWLKGRMHDIIELEMVLIPWMEVNDKIEYISPKTSDVTTVIVQSIDYDFRKWTMTARCAKFYPYYPWE